MTISLAFLAPRPQSRCRWRVCLWRANKTIDRKMPVFKTPHHHLTILRAWWHCGAIGREIGRDVCHGVLARQGLAGEQQALPAKRGQPTELEEEPKLRSSGDLFATREERCGDRRSTGRHQLSASD
jgi:hypothetical protein